MTIDEIREAFPGYHVRIDMYPTGGTIEASGCEECGTAEVLFFSSSWRIGTKRTIQECVLRVQRQIKDQP